MPRNMLFKLCKNVERRTNRQRDVNQIVFRDGISERTRRGLVNDTASKSLIGNVRGVPTVNGNVGRVFFQGKRERAADEARAQNSHALNQMRRHETKSLQC